MADFDSVRDSINASIKQNGTGAITGPVLNGVLNEMVDAADDQVSQLGLNLNNVGVKVSFTGANSTFAHNVNTGVYIKGGHTYRLTPTTKAWSHANISNSDSACLAIGYGGQNNNLYTLSRTLWQFEDYYDITFPNAADGTELYVGGRADAGAVVEFTVIDITDEISIKDKTLIPLVSKKTEMSNNMTAIYLPVNIKAGKKYVVHSRLPDELISLASTSVSSSAFKIWTSNAMTTTAIDTIKQILYRGSEFQNAYYEFTATQDAEYVAFFAKTPNASIAYDWEIEVGIYPSSMRINAEGNEYIGERIALATTKNPYTEEVIPVEGIERYNGNTQQGLAIYGKYAFLTYNTGYIQILDLESLTIVSAYTMPEGVYGANNHAGVANFGPIFYNSSDTFPLLYISSYAENKCYVLRVTLSSCSLVQTITMANAWHFLVDNQGRMIVHKDDWSTYQIFDAPDISEPSVNLNASDAKDSFVFDTPNMRTAGAFCQNGKMYILCYYITTPTGISGAYDRMIVYDYINKRTSAVVVFNKGDIRNVEFEGLSPTQDGDIMVSFVANQLAKLVFLP